MNSVKTALIKSIEIDGLFGLYNYRLPPEGEFGDAVILYGDNGVGKSTLLRLAFHLLSAAEQSGHRTALIKTKFTLLRVTLSNGIELLAERPDQAEERLQLSVRRERQVVASWSYVPGRRTWAEYEELEQFVRQQQTLLSSGLRKLGKRKPPAPNEGEKPYLAALAQHAPAVFLLNAERRLDSDAVPNPSDEVEMRRLFRMGEPKSIHDVAVRSREIALSQALSRAAKWMNARVLQSANRGSNNVHSVYESVLRHLLDTPDAKASLLPSDKVDSLSERLRSIEIRSKELATYELTTELSMDGFNQALQSPSTQAIVSALIEPYVQSLEKRFDPLESTFTVLNRFVTTVNEFLTDKELLFTPREGFAVRNKLGVTLEPGDLSSGEQQLLLLMSYVLVARDQPSVFMIDEPELSLNIKWQRQLVRSLLNIAEGADTQFVFASHSIELLSQHRSRVVALKEASDAPA